MVNVPQQILILGVKLYRWVLSPVKTALFGPLGRCRFEPSCSAYALEALQTHGAAKGSWLAVRRLCRCHPWGDFGPDPVPPKCGMRHAECRAEGDTQKRGHRTAQRGTSRPAAATNACAQSNLPEAPLAIGPAAEAGRPALRGAH
jgi:putative membrane protein insertion efficiency factor